MSHSVRLRFVGWLKSLFDHGSQMCVQILRDADVHADAARNLGNGLVGRVPDGASKGQVNNAEILTGFHQQIDIMNRFAGIADFQKAVTDRQPATAPNNYLVSHVSVPSQSSLDLAKVNARALGVES